MLLLVEHLFPDWVIARDGCGIWWASGRGLVSASDVGGLLDMLVVADPEGARRAVSLLSEK